MNPINTSTSPAIFWWKPAAWLRASGPDAAGFLQGQFTNDLARLQPGGTVYGLWLNLKGKVVADSFVVRGSEQDDFWIGSYFSPAAVIRERLESNLIADEVVIEDQTEGWMGLTRLGAEVATGDGVVGGVMFAGRRSREAAVETVFPLAGWDDMRARWAGAPELDEVAMTRRRIVAAIPAVPVDVGPADLPNEAGLETDAISYTKGCYLGQEVMARLKSMGRVRRRLWRVAGRAETLPPLPAPLFGGGKPVGELRSAIAAGDGTGGFIGLAMLSLLVLPPDGLLALAADGPADWRVTDTP
ncbi:MAG: folate-binding protein [Opitutus sp.]|nr:folate-binding protein [Opitutus sp.]